MNQTGALAFSAGILIFMLVIGLAVHLFFGYCFKQIALKTGHEEDAGLWWIPIVNLLIPIRVAGKPGWWLLLMLVPFVNIVVNIIIWMAVAEARGKENWWGIVAALVSIVGIPYIALSDSEAAIV